MKYMAIFRRKLPLYYQQIFHWFLQQWCWILLKKLHQTDSVVSIQLIGILGKPFYQVRCVSSIHNKANHQNEMSAMNHLAHAETGKLRGPLSKEEAIAVARMQFNGGTTVKKTEYLTAMNNHHEYRENPLPAYAVTFLHPSMTTIYVASELGTVQKFRNNKWRVFDFLWMMHTMDYEGRDDFGNILLRIFSIAGLITVMSGFLLFFISARWRWRIK